MAPRSPRTRHIPGRRRRSGRSPLISEEPRGCVDCGCPLPFALVGEGERCYECQARAAGRATLEAHHVLPRAIDPAHTVPLPGNLHRGVEEAKYAWPAEVRSPGPPDPLLTSVMLLLSMRDLCRLLADHYLPAHIDYLLRLHAALTARYGPNWGNELKVPESLWPPRQP